MVHVVVECPRGSSAKLKYDPRLDAMTLSRTLPFGVVFPYDFGFVPSTRAEDGDPLDGIILCEASTFPGVVIACRQIGVIQASQRDKGSDVKRRVRNDRVVFIAGGDHRSEILREASELAERVRDELAAFFIAARAATSAIERARTKGRSSKTAAKR
jgi:inorganic pyrophosphatase